MALSEYSEDVPSKQTFFQRFRGVLRSFSARVSTALARPFIFPLIRRLKHDSNPPSGFVSEKIRAEDGVELEAWSLIHKPTLPTILVFHGNTPTLRSSTPLLRELARSGKVNVLAVDYRGYGYSQGSPSEDGLYRDGEALLSYAERLGVARANLLFLGESLGSGVAVEMIRRHPECKGAVLVAPYSSVASFYPEELRSLPKDRFNSLEKMPTIHNKVLILHGGEDSVIPAWHGFRLKNAGNNTEMVFLPKEKHAIDPEVISKTVIERLGAFNALKPKASLEADSHQPWKKLLAQRGQGQKSESVRVM